MKMLRHTYEDPTGGGEDITLIAPEWVDPPLTITAFHVEDTGERFEFGLGDTEDDEN